MAQYHSIVPLPSETDKDAVGIARADGSVWGFEPPSERVILLTDTVKKTVTEPGRPGHRMSREAAEQTIAEFEHQIAGGLIPGSGMVPPLMGLGLRTARELRAAGQAVPGGGPGPLNDKDAEIRRLRAELAETKAVQAAAVLGDPTPVAPPAAEPEPEGSAPPDTAAEA